MLAVDAAKRNQSLTSGCFYVLYLFMALDLASTEGQADRQADSQTATQQNTQYYLRVLHELIEMGTDFARQLHRQACPPAEAAPPATDPSPEQPSTQHLSVAFDRIARAIRRTIALAQKLSEPVEARSASRFGPDGARQRNLRGAGDHAKPAEKDVSKMTDAEIQERLDRLERDLDDDVPPGPMADVIANICRDLGITDVPATRLWKRCIVADLKYVLVRAQAQIDRNASPPADTPPANTLVATQPRNAGSKSTDPPPR